MRLGHLTEADRDRLRSVIGAAGLPLRGPDWPAARYLDYMSIDKKAAKGVPRFVVLRRIGEAAVEEVAPSLVEATIAANTVAAAPA